ncbi:hypothetical protein KW797_02890 [Candidatus Parcubacteria bacterium]|nr:hypothetical protein [Candidatus Parcubacteria bacterium]
MYKHHAALLAGLVRNARLGNSRHEHIPIIEGTELFMALERAACILRGIPPGSECALQVEKFLASAKDANLHDWLVVCLENANGEREELKWFLSQALLGLSSAKRPVPRPQKTSSRLSTP